MELSKLLLLRLHIQFRDTHDVVRIEVNRGLEGPVSLGLCVGAGASGDVLSAFDVSDVLGAVELDSAGVLGSQHTLASRDPYCAGHDYLLSVAAHAHNGIVLVARALVAKGASQRGC